METNHGHGHDTPEDTGDPESVEVYYRLRIERDDSAESPADWGNDGAFILADHRQFAPRAPKGWDLSRAERIYRGTSVCIHCGSDITRDSDTAPWEDDTGNAPAICPSAGGYREDGTPEEEPHEPSGTVDSDTAQFAVFPLFAYIHSGIALSLGRGYPFSDPWDSGQIGYLVVDRSEFPGATEERIREIAEGTVETWNQYLSGDVYGYILERVSTCDHGHEHAEIIDSVWGFYGHEHAEEEGKSSLEYHKGQGG